MEGKNKGFLGVLWYNLFDSKNDAGRIYSWEQTERNFGIIETPQNVGGEGEYPVPENDLKDSWMWLTMDMDP